MVESYVNNLQLWIWIVVVGTFVADHQWRLRHVLGRKTNPSAFEVPKTIIAQLYVIPTQFGEG